MSITNKDVERLKFHLQEWNGGEVYFNAFHDDHDRLIIKLVHPRGEQEPVGLSLFYCSYLAGPIKWGNSNLVPKVWMGSDGQAGLELIDEAAGFVVRCASAALYGQPGLVVPKE